MQLPTTPMIALALGLVLGGAGSTAAQDAQDWSQWRGPGRDGQIVESAWLKAWPSIDLKDSWTKEVGDGYAAVSVVGDRGYTAGHVSGDDVVVCFSTETGKSLWEHKYDARKYSLMNAGGPAATPSVVDGRVFTVSRGGVMYCLQAADGKVIWTKDLKRTHGADVPTWGFSGSPLVRGDRVYVDVGVIIAFDPATGKEVWKTEQYASGYSSPIHFNQGGVDYLAVFPADGLKILKEADGTEVASHGWKTKYNVNAATPLILGDGRIFISSGYNTGGAMLRFDGTSLTRLWKTRKMRNQMSSCVYLDGFLYGFDESRLVCLEADTGEVQWRQGGLGKGSLMLCEGKLVVLGGLGELVIAEASNEEFAPSVRRKVLGGGNCWTIPVVSHGRIYCRDPEDKLHCLEVMGVAGEEKKSDPKKSDGKKSTPF